MRRRLSLALLTVVAFFAIVLATRYLSPGTRAANRVASTGGSDSLARLDSAARGEPQQDTMCFASRVGLPCDPR